MRRYSLKDKVKLVIFSTGIISIASLLIFAASGGADVGRVEVDARGCATVGAIDSLTLVFVDNTDAHLPGHVEAFSDFSQRLIEKSGSDVANGGDLVGVVSIKEDRHEFLFLKCSPRKPNPPDGIWEALLALWYNPNENWRDERIAYQREFQKPFAEIMASMPTNEVGNQSPIIENLHAALRRLGDYRDRSNKLTVVLFSDMMQNVNTSISHYSQSVDSMIDNFKSSDVPFTSLGNAGVEIYYLRGIPVSEKYQGEEHIGFWKWYFLSSQADYVEVKEVEGATLSFNRVSPEGK